jgi:hypothetical protein
MSLYHLVYFSTRSNLTDADLAVITAVSAVNNAREGLTGCLLLDGTHCFQVVEGARGPLSALLGRLMRDPRHRDVTIADFSRIDHRAFRSWNMAPIHLDSPAITDTYARYTRDLPDPTELSGAQIWDMLESMAQIVEDEAIRPRWSAVSK